MSKFIDSITGELEKAESQIGIQGASVIAVIFNFFVCFFGYRFHKIIIALVGFLVGAEIGYGISSNITGEEHVRILLAVLLGLVISLLAYSVYKLGICILVFGLAYEVVLPVLNGMFDENLAIILTIIVGIFVALTTLRFIRPVIIVTTAIAGGVLGVRTLGTLIGFTNPMGLTLFGILAAFLGVVYQFNSTEEL